MAMNAVYRGPADCPGTLPVFPLAGALLLPRGHMPLNIFEPRYLAMIDDALKSHRLIGMIQPMGESDASAPPLAGVGCAGRITQISETGDGRYHLTLTGVSRFRVEEELAVLTPYRQCRVDFTPFEVDFQARAGEDLVDRPRLVASLRQFVDAYEIKVDWRGVEQAPNEALVNALCMMCPFGPAEKQALLEAPDLRTRAEVLIAITELELARLGEGPEPTLQ